MIRNIFLMLGAMTEIQYDGDLNDVKRFKLFFFEIDRSELIGENVIL
jgi:hypothetical protein